MNRKWRQEYTKRYGEAWLIALAFSIIRMIALVSAWIAFTLIYFHGGCTRFFDICFPFLPSIFPANNPRIAEPRRREIASESGDQQGRPRRFEKQSSAPRKNPNRFKSNLVTFIPEPKIFLLLPFPMINNFDGFSKLQQGVNCNLWTKRECARVALIPRVRLIVDGSR